MNITEQEKKTILGLHHNSKNVYGDLVVESESNRNHGIKYHIQVGVYKEKAPAEFLAKVKQLGVPIKKIQDKGGLYKYVLKKSWDSYLGNLQLGLWGVRDTFPDAFIYAEKDGKRIGIEQAQAIESGGDVATETESEFPNLELSDSLDLKKMPTFNPTKESKVYKCTMDGCAAYVSDVLGNVYQGNAWHAHRMGNNVYSSFENAGTRQNNSITNLFNKINRNPQPKQGLSDAKNITKSLVPNQQKFSNLELNDVVGLFYEPSEMHTTAFFEAMTGVDEMGKGSKAGDGPFMIKADGSGQWSKEDLGKDIKFKPGKTLSKGMVPGLNTHLGFVGAINNGEPIIFHNIHKQVHATPLSEMDKNGTAIVWARRGQQNTPKKDNEKGTLDKVKDEFMYYYNKISSNL